MKLDRDDSLLGEFVEDQSESSFCELVNRHHDLVARIVHKRVADRESAKEIVQNVFALMARKAPTLVRHPTVSGWLIRTAVLETKKHHRKELSRMKRESIHAKLKEFTEGGQPFSESDYLRVETALADLSVVHRDAILMRYYHKASFIEIGARFGKSNDAAQKMVSRAIDRLRRLLDGDASASGVSTSTVSAMLAGLFTMKPIAVGAATFLALGSLKSATTISKTALFANSLLTIMTATQIKITVGLGILAALPLVYQWNSRDQIQAPAPSSVTAGARNSQPLATEADPELKEASSADFARNRIVGGQRMGAAGVNASADDTPAVNWPLRMAENLVKDLRHEEWKVRRGAAALLNGSNVPASLAVPALLEAVHDEEWQVRKPVADALAFYGPEAAAATPALVTSLYDEEWHVRESAAHALSKIGPAAQEAVPDLAERLYDEEWHVRRVAAEALGAIGEPSGGAVMDLVEALGDEEWQVRSPAAKALASIGPDAAPGIAALSDLLNDEEWPVAVNASAALASIGEAAESTVPSLVRALEHEEAQVRGAAALALGSLGGNSPHVIGSLQGLIGDPATEVGQAASIAIMQIRDGR